MQDVAASIARPVQELKAFTRVTLQPGESQVVPFTVTTDMLRFYNAEGNWVAEPGRFDVMVGLDSRDALTRRASFRLEETV